MLRVAPFHTQVRVVIMTGNLKLIQIKLIRMFQPVPRYHV